MFEKDFQKVALYDHFYRPSNSLLKIIVLWQKGIATTLWQMYYILITSNK